MHRTCNKKKDNTKISYREDQQIKYKNLKDWEQIRTIQNLKTFSDEFSELVSVDASKEKDLKSWRFKYIVCRSSTKISIELNAQLGICTN